MTRIFSAFLQSRFLLTLVVFLRLYNWLACFRSTIGKSIWTFTFNNSYVIWMFEQVLVRFVILLCFLFASL